MSKIIWLIFLGIFLFLITSTTFVVGIIKKRTSLIYKSFVPAILLLLTIAYTGYIVISKSANYLNEAFKPRTGLEVYQAVLGESNFNCSEILHFQDKEFPILDFAITIHFKTCAEELERILDKHSFSKSYVSTYKWNEEIETGVQLDWLNPKAMGDTIVVYEYSTNNSQYVKTLWTSMDGTEVYCRLIN